MSEIKNNPKVYIPYNVYNIIEGLWQDHITLEWSIIGRVKKHNDKFIVTDIFIPKQKNQKAYTEMTDPLEDIQEHLISHNIIDSSTEWRLWLHSHNTMQPFWSGTDDNTRKALCTDTFREEDKGYGWSLSIVIGNNKKFHATVDYAYIDNGKKVVSFQDVDVVVGLGGGEYIPTEQELEEINNSFVNDNNNVLEIFPGEIANGLLEKSRAVIENYKKNQISQLIKNRTMEEALNAEQELYNEGILYDIPSLEEFISELKSKEILNTYQYDTKKKEERNEDLRNGNLFSQKTSFKDHGFMYSEMRRGYVKASSDKVYTFYEVQNEINGKKDNRYSGDDIKYDDLINNGFVRDNHTMMWHREGEEGYVTMRKAKEIIAEEWNKYLYDEEEVYDNETFDSFDLLNQKEKVELIEDKGYFWDTIMKKRKIATAPGIFSVFENFDEALEDYKKRYLNQNYEEDSEINYEEELLSYGYKRKGKGRKLGRQKFGSTEEAYNHLSFKL